MNGTACDHLLQLDSDPVPPGGCVECLETGSSWVHLRFCTNCAVVRCCDSSPNQHASKHASSSGHPVVRSAEPGEMWAYCYEHDLTLGDVAFAKYMRP